MNAEQTKKKQQVWATVIFSAFCAIMGMVMISCESGGGGGGSSGSSTITGHVDTFSAGSAFFKAKNEKGWMAWLKRVDDLIVVPAQAAVAGVSVKVAGTDLESTTADDGLFVISGVPAGSQQLIFSFNGSSATYSLDVTDNSTITMNNIHVSGDSVDAGHVEVEVHPDDNANENDNGNDNTDDHGNDNGHDDNGNDNGGDNGNDNGNGNEDSGGHGSGSSMVDG